jgi:hypothetical protein
VKKIISGIMLALILTFFALPVWAALTYQAPFIVGFDSGNQTYTSSPGTYTTVYTGETTNGLESRILGLWASSTDTSTAHVVSCQIWNGSTSYYQFSVTVAIQSTSVPTPPLNMLAATDTGGTPQDNNQNQFLDLHNGELLKCTYSTALSTGAINVRALIYNF